MSERWGLERRAMSPLSVAVSQNCWRYSVSEMEQGIDSSRPKVSPQKLQEQGRNAVVAFVLN
jgi:hypothetical protein